VANRKQNLVVGNIFLSLGTLLYIYAKNKGISLPDSTDDLYPMLAMNYFGLPVAIAFLLGIIAAAYSSADSALTALTTSFSVDVLRIQKYKDESKRKKMRILVHIGFSVVLMTAIMIFKAINDESVIDTLFVVAGYTYGPLLGLFAFGIFTKYDLKNGILVPMIAILSPVICFIISTNSEKWFGGYKFGYELLILNGLLTFTGLFLIRDKSRNLSRIQDIKS